MARNQTRIQTIWLRFYLYLGYH
ncbi:hypothetical protein SCOCK_1120004 [Actinacidiphila cocklensis]|uniref:Uncharacterized protein n=1 Tax=Actinacidiphila cocklensis TaxID=887465 RepID=A0A9W4DKH0_9ACTN|nr:hypothetical protein SCOCK_1120004 [Actinacidiphila cocklensis]